MATLLRQSWIKGIIFIGLLMGLCYIFYQKYDDIHKVIMLSPDILAREYMLLGLVVLLLPVNWSLEAWKWQLLTGLIEKNSFGHCIKQILTGLSMSLVLPFGVGEWAGRSLQMQSEGRLQSAGALIVNRASQLLITIIMAIPSLVYTYIHFEQAVQLLVFAGLVLLTMVVWWAIIRSKKLPAMRHQLYAYVAIIHEYSWRLIIQVIALSGLRYIVFSMQFLLLLFIYRVDIPLSTLILGISFIFFMKSVIPTLFEMGVRENAALYFFASYPLMLPQILVVSILLWLINIFIPAIAGLVFVKDFNWKNRA